MADLAVSEKSRISGAQRRILGNAIGLDFRIKMRRRKMKEDEFRNRFCVAIGGDNELDVAALISLGLMTRGETINRGTCYMAYATEAGIEEAMPSRTNPEKPVR